MNRKGIILAGGTGSRLYPITSAISKQLIPIYDKPMIYYPLTTLMLSGIRDILIITTVIDKLRFMELLQDGSQWGINISYATQDYPGGIPQAFIVGEKFINDSCTALILGDNIFYGNTLTQTLVTASNNSLGASIFGYHVSDPERYGIATFNKEHKVIDIIEKPKNPQSNIAVTGLYFYDTHAVEFAKMLSPSSRGELEITDLNKIYLANSNLNINILGRGTAWFDTGTSNSLIEASNFVQMMQMRQGLHIACPEEIAFNKGWMDLKKLEKILKKIPNSTYGLYVKNILSTLEI